MKNLCKKNNIPTANHSTFSKETIDQAYTFLEQMPLEERLMCILSSGKGKVMADFLLKGTTL